MYNDLFTKAKEKKLEQLKIYKIEEENITIETYNDKIDKYNTSILDTYKVSAIYQNKKVKITTETLDNTILDKLINQSKIIEIPSPQTRTKLENIKEQKSYKINDFNQIINDLLSLYKLKKTYPLLKEINTYYSETIIKRTITTEENKLYDIKKETSFATEVTVSENEKNSTSYETSTNIEDKKINFEELTKSAIQNAIDKLHYQEIKSGTYSVILTSKVMGNILNSFISLFSADSIQKDTSLLKTKLNTRTFSPKITITEDPTNQKLIGKRLFDDTGTKTKYKEIIKNGIFITPLHNERTSSIDKVQNTANDYGEISVRNMSIKSGNKSLEEIIHSLKKGILIDNVVGLHAGINPITGDISLQSEGYYIESGTKQYATKLFVLSTNIMEILNNVKDISNHKDIILSTTSSPDLLITNIKISK